MATPTTPTERVLYALPDARLNGAGWVCKCPAHDDKSPSLSISTGDDGRVLLKCHAGCPTRDVVAAMGRTMADLMPEARPDHGRGTGQHSGSNGKATTPRRIVATYDYISAAGELVYQVVRYDPKDFRQRRPDARGGWTWNLQGIDRVLYRLPDLIAAGPDAFIYIVEGEKDADRLHAEGIVATTCPQGAGKWSKVDATPLHGRHVVIIPDADATGLNHAREVVAALLGKAASVRLLELPGLDDKGDVSDWLDAGHDGEELVQLAEALPELEATPDRIQQDDQTEGRRLIMKSHDSVDMGGMQFLWKRRIPTRGLAIVFSRPGRGKSTLAARIASHVTTGTDWPDGEPCERGRIIYVRGEGSEGSIAQRLDYAGADRDRWGIIGAAADDDDKSGMFDLTNDAELLEPHITSDTRLLIVDTFDSCFSGVRMIDNGAIRKALWGVQSIAERHDLAVVILAHTNKGAYADPLDRLSGGRAIGAAARVVWYLGKERRDDDDVVMAPVKANDFNTPGSYTFTLRGITPDAPPALTWGEASDVSAWDLDRPEPAGQSIKADAAAEWLQQLLERGPVVIGDARRRAKDAGFGTKAINTARDALDITSEPQKGVFPVVRWWCLPGQTPPAPPPE